MLSVEVISCSKRQNGNGTADFVIANKVRATIVGRVIRDILIFKYERLNFQRIESFSKKCVYVYIFYVGSLNICI